MKRVLITDDVHPLLLDGLAHRNYISDYLPNIRQGECLEIIHHYQGLIINSKIRADQDLLQRASQLKWIARLGSGMEIIDLPAAQAKGIFVFNSPEGNRQAVAEHALAMLLALLRNIPRANHQLKALVWQREPNRGTELSGKTVGIIGYGHTGSRFAKVLEGLDVNILIFDKYKQLCTSHRRFEFVKNVENIQRLADVISIHLPLTQETLYMVDYSFLEKCKTGCILINTSRGKICKTDDLIRALHRGKLGGACLDVFENENPEQFSPQEKKQFEQLMAMENIVVTPHIAGWTHQSKEKIARVVLEKLDQRFPNIYH